MKKIIIPWKTYAYALAVEKNNFIRYYCGRLERNGGDESEAESYMRSRAAEFPLIIGAYGGSEILNRNSYAIWLTVASAGKSPNDNCDIGARLDRLVKNFK